MKTRTNRNARFMTLLTAAMLAIPSAAVAGESLFRMEMDINSSPLSGYETSSDVVQLVENFIERNGSGFGPIGAIALINGYTGELDYLGMQNAIQIDVQPGATQATIVIPSIGLTQDFAAATPSALLNQIEYWVKDDALGDWSDFLREANASSPLAVTSGNPRSTVALVGSSAYRRFGFDDSRSRFGYETKVQRWGGFHLRVDAGASSLDVGQFNDDLWTVDPTLTLAGQFGRTVGLSFSIIGQYRDYDGGQIGDLGLELALPITILRPNQNPSWFWQITPLIQAAAGASKDLAAGGLFMGGGLVSGLARQMGNFEFLMANQIMYYNGIPVEDIGGYDFETKLSQLYFKNGLEGTWYPGLGFYLDAGVHFSNFALDDAAVSWYATPTVGVGWKGGRWFDLRVSYEPDVASDYTAHAARLKLDFLF